MSRSGKRVYWLGFKTAWVWYPLTLAVSFSILVILAPSHTLSLLSSRWWGNWYIKTPWKYQRYQFLFGQYHITKHERHIQGRDTIILLLRLILVDVCYEMRNDYLLKIKLICTVNDRMRIPSWGQTLLLFANGSFEIFVEFNVMKYGLILKQP